MKDEVELVDRIARHMAHSAGYVWATMGNLAPFNDKIERGRDFWRTKAERILNDPEIARWRSIAQSYDEARLGHDIRSD